MNIRISQKMWLSIGATLVLAALVWVVGTAVAQRPDDGSPLSPAGGPSETMAFSYQGRLEDNGQPATGYYDFLVSLYDAQTLGSYIGSCSNVGTGNLNQYVEDGIFTFYLICGGWNSDVFDGDGRWLEVWVRPHDTGSYISLPRQPISPAPYAFSLFPGATIKGGVSSPSAVISVTQTYGNPWDSAFGVYGYAPETGVYGRGDTTGVGGFGHWRGVYGQGGLYGVYGSGNDTGVRGYSGSGYGGYFQGGVGLGARGTGTPAQDGYAASFISENYRGIYAQSLAGYYAAYFDSAAGIYSSGGYSSMAANRMVVVNGGDEPLEPGDVVAIAGVVESPNGGEPLLAVRRADASNGAAVVGVVVQAMRVEMVEIEGVESLDVQPVEGSIPPGGYLAIVTSGLVTGVKVDVPPGDLRIGDWLAVSTAPGFAGMATAESRDSGAILGKVAGPVDAENGTVPVFVTLR